MTATSDIYLATFIWASGYKKYKTEKEIDNRKNKVRVVFVFDMPEKDFENLKQGFFDGSGKCSGLEFMNGYRNLKNICFMD